MKSKNNTAVIILNYNGEKFLKKCFESLRNQTNKNFDLYFVDNASTDNSVSLIEKIFPSVTIYKLKNNLGVGHGFNYCIKKIKHKYKFLCLLNPDIVLDKNWFDALITSIKKDESADILASKIFFSDKEKIDSMGGSIYNLLLGIFGGFMGNKKNLEIPKNYTKQSFPVFFGLITSMIVRSKCFYNNSFDENYFMYFEDIDFSWRVILNGGNICCCPKSIVYHYGHGTINTKNTQLKVLQHAETNLLLTYFKNLSALNLVLVMPITFFSRIILSLIYLPISPKITFAKLKGIFTFFKYLFSKSYFQTRQTIQNNRKITDRMAFQHNPQRNQISFIANDQIKKWLIYSKSFLKKISIT